MKRSLIALLFVVLATLSIQAATTTLPSVTLAWDRSQDPGVNSYRIYYGAASRTYTNWVLVTPVTLTTVSISNLVRDVTYYFAATCLTTNGVESAYSSEVFYHTTPLPPPPQGLTVTTQNP